MDFSSLMEPILALEALYGCLPWPIHALVPLPDVPKALL
jgi:hypothetical protein